MNKKIRNIAALAAIASLAGLALTSPAYAVGAQTTQGNGSYGPVYIFKGGLLQDSTATPNSPVKNVFAWDDVIYTSALSTDLTEAGAFSCPSTSTNSVAFLSSVGSETTKSGWIRFGRNLGTLTPSAVDVTPEGMSNGTTAASTAKAATGSFSLGIACTSNSGATVDRAHFRSISKTDATGAYTVAATEYLFTAPTLGYTQAVSGAYSTAHTGDTLTATLADSAVAAGFAVTYQWYANSVAISGETGATYLTVANDAGKVFAVAANYTRNGYASKSVSNVSGQNITLVGDAVVSGDVPANASVVAPTNGALSLSLPSSPSITLTGVRDAATNTSISTGTLSNVQVIEGRVTSRDGWDLNITWSNFVKSDDSSMIIDKSQLGISTAINSAPSAGDVTSGSARVAGASYPSTSWNALYQAKKGPTNGNVVADTVGTTTITNTFTLVAPQWKPAGTYRATVTYTVASR
jgi:hypothetical protein